MSTNPVRSIDASVARVDMKFEVAVLPVSDVDRAKEFYGKLGWRLDADFRFDNGFRVVQFTPPGSACSIQFGTNMTSAVPGSAQGLYLVVFDIEAARKELVARAVEISNVFHAGTPPRSTCAISLKRNRSLLQSVPCLLPRRLPMPWNTSMPTELCAWTSGQRRSWSALGITLS